MCEKDGCSYNVNDKAHMSTHAKYHHKSKMENLAFTNDPLDLLSLAPSESGLYVGRCNISDILRNTFHTYLTNSLLFSSHQV